MAKRRKPLGAGIGVGIGTDVGKGLAESLDDWQRLPGTAQRYKNKRTGKTISRRQYENIRARSVGWRNWSEYQREAATDDWIRWRGIVARRNDLSYQNPKVSGMGSEFSEHYLKLKRARNGGHPDLSILYDPDGPLAEWLVYLGLRQPDADWDVGESP